MKYTVCGVYFFPLHQNWPISDRKYFLGSLVINTRCSLLPERYENFHTPYNAKTIIWPAIEKESINYALSTCLLENTVITYEGCYNIHASLHRYHTLLYISLMLASASSLINQ